MYFCRIVYQTKNDYVPTGYQIMEQSKIHYMTFQVVYWIDVFSRKIYRDLFLDDVIV